MLDYSAFLDPKWRNEGMGQAIYNNSNAGQVAQILLLPHLLHHPDNRGRPLHPQSRALLHRLRRLLPTIHAVFRQFDLNHQGILQPPPGQVPGPDPMS